LVEDPQDPAPPCAPHTPSPSKIPRCRLDYKSPKICALLICGYFFKYSSGCAQRCAIIARLLNRLHDPVPIADQPLLPPPGLTAGAE
jgi:hypothetical protein